ncbi:MULTISPECIES: glycine zipper domain-containing protein [Prevotella]|uniref:Glycine zipper family protein n=1 Tax=Prevotella herbatica TaxID=2801997 RepID=A0ABM7NWP0_9BACT|nr:MULTISPECIES: glycine zipper domain-containing protein [Prevotella]MDN5552874.1 glycine zipper domain-containing protein [Prevotella sp.]BCS84923.1 hypothetical protein prwr041_08160 [Prevotella herbatica]
MRKTMIMFAAIALILGSCGTYTGDGAFIGSNLGSILGSAIGGIANGPRGSDIGTIVGMAGGAVVGAVVGNAADQRVDNARCRDVGAPVALEQTYSVQPQYQDNIVDESNSGDDRIYDFNSSDYTTNNSTRLPVSKETSTPSPGITYQPVIEIRNARFIDDNMDGKIQRGELSKIIFEVMNHSSETLVDVQPKVIETTGNNHIKISPSIHIEKILPGTGIRYTALVLADHRLSRGVINLNLSVFVSGKQQTFPTEFQIPTIR